MHILCLLQPFFSSRSQSLAFRKEWNDKSSNADSKNAFIVLSSCCPFEKTCSAMSALVFFGADAILANVKAWDLVLWKCPRRSTTPGGVLLYMGYIGMCRCEGYGFQAVYSSIGYINQAPVVQRLDNAIHRINHYPADSVVCFVNTYPLDSDLSGG